MPRTCPLETGLRPPNGALVLTAFLLVCLNLRIVFGGVGPQVPYMDLSPLTAGLVTSLPALSMGLFSPFAAFAGHRFRQERALFLGMLILTLGIGLRSFGTPGLLSGMVVAGIGVALLNVLTPVFVRQHFAAEKMGLMMGIFAMMMGLGGAAMAALAVPVYHASGGSFSLSLGTAAVPALLALAALTPFLRTRPQPKQTDHPAPSWRWLLTHPTAWSLISFFGLMSLVFYAVLAWLPALLIARGTTASLAGIYLALCFVAVALGAFFAPAHAARHPGQHLHITGACLLCILGLLGVWLAPVPAAPAACTLLGLGLGAGLGLPGVLFIKRTSGHRQMIQLSGMVQTASYLIAAAGPVLTGLLHDWSGGWALPLQSLIALLAAALVLGLRSGKDHVMDGRDGPVKEGAHTKTGRRIC